MKSLNTFVRGMFYFFLVLYMLLQGAVTGLFVSGSLLAFVLAVWSAVSTLPAFLTDKLWLVYLLSASPVTLAVFIYLLVDLIQAQLKKNNKQDNGNH